MNDIMLAVDSFVYSPAVRPYYGWHEDQVAGRPYMPAVHQVRSEFVKVLGMIADHGLLRGSCLQLGIGPTPFSHEVWRKVFGHVVSIDLSQCFVDDVRSEGRNTHTLATGLFAGLRGSPFDFLFIDAGHSLEDVADDYGMYHGMVRSGGLIAFHDALDRPGYPEVKVHEFIKSLPVTVFGDEVGTAVMERT